MFKFQLDGRDVFCLALKFHTELIHFEWDELIWPDINQEKYYPKQKILIKLAHQIHSKNLSEEYFYWGKLWSLFEVFYLENQFLTWIEFLIIKYAKFIKGQLLNTIKVHYKKYSVWLTKT